METKHYVRYLKDSPAARLVRRLAGRYELCAVSGEALSHANNGHAADGLAGPAVWLADPASDCAAGLRDIARNQPGVRLIAVTSASADAGLEGEEWFACLPCNAAPAFVTRAIAGAFANIELAERERIARESLAQAELEREELNRIGVALSSTHDVTALLEMILAKTLEITSADAGSLYLVETVRAANGGPTKANGKAEESVERRLRFKATQNDSRQFPFSEFTVALSENSLAGYAALHGEVIALDDAYAVPEDRAYRFNPSYDEETGYRTRSLLTLPMKNARHEVIGLLQLLNCKRHRAAKLLTPEDVDREVIPFPARAISLAESLASQAAVAFENSRLYHDIETLFEGFVQAAVTAIEQRDPTTSGHSLRVSQMTVGLADILQRCETGRYRRMAFTQDQMKEIRYAALLHDFGKVGIREEILVKAKKLYPAQFDIVQKRFDYARKGLEADCERQKFQALLSSSREVALRRVQELDRRISPHGARNSIRPSSKLWKPTSRPCLRRVNSSSCLKSPGALTATLGERSSPCSRPTKFVFSRFRKAASTPDERQQIESHVVHSFNFLMQIPWTREIRGIPEIARAHHEKLDGSGYPYKLKGEDIPVQARMMTICDIFDALSAADRPYKKAVPPERALADARGRRVQAGTRRRTV